MKHFHLINAPASAKVTNLEDWNARTLVDYSKHPAYSDYVNSATLGTRLTSLYRFFPSWALIKLKRAISYEAIPLHIRKSKGMVSWFKKLSVIIRHLIRRERPNNHSLKGNLTEMDMSFRKNGCAVIQSPESIYDEVLSLSRPYFDRLESARRQSNQGHRIFEESRSYARRDESTELFECIERVFHEAGVIGTASAYLGRQASLIDVNPQINDPSDDFWKRQFPDVEGELPSCAYFHRDASGGDIKVIIYMSDVGSENGAFSYVLGSHTMPLKKSDDHISEANDSNGLAATDPDSRRLFSSLPAVFRHKGSFGNDILDGSELSKLISDGTWQITADKGSIVMFDTKGIHRGGMVALGERRVITCVIG